MIDTKEIRDLVEQFIDDQPDFYTKMNAEWIGGLFLEWCGAYNTGTLEQFKEKHKYGGL